jgi:N-methylhydantoinase A/oxoprolinase/acetone carboxylase beta subunit
MAYRLGIDVGGTMTDAVILDAHDAVVAKTKVPNSDDIVSGIREAIDQVLRSSEVPPTAIQLATLGTTQVTNAIIERKHLSPVLAIRLGAPATLGVKPLAAWPDDLAVGGRSRSVILRGGHEFDGRPIAPLDELGVAEAARKARGSVEAVAITGVFSPVVAAHEERAAEIVREELGDIPVSLSSRIGSIGLLERENAAVLNAMVTTVARRVVQMFKDAVRECGIGAALYLAQNDGTLMDLEHAQQYPILMVACGPTNSMRGAAFLSRLKDAVVVDVGGTSTDVGVLVNGFPRESAVAVEVGGVRTNFRMPDLISVGLGGGSVVRTGGRVSVGPDSVGYRLVREAHVFGGDTLTFTDVAVRMGRGPVGDPARLRVAEPLARQAYQVAVDLVVDAIARMKTSAEPVPLVAVGGGSFALPDELPEVSRIIRPDHYEVANAIGAAMAQVSGRVDRIYNMEGRRREEVLEEAEEQARREAIAAGADPSSLQLVDREELPLSYLPGNATRVRLTVVGTLTAWKETGAVL